MNSAFAGYHPAVGLAYFSAVLGFSMAFMHPAALCISLVGAFVWSARLGGPGTARRSLTFVLPVLLLTALLSPAFNHAGATILTYLPTGNPLTLESILYGAAAAVMLVTVIGWFTCLNRVMTADKLVYLFGRAAPALSLVLSMALRFVPRFRRRLKLVSDAQKGLGHDPSGGSVLRRVRHGMRVLSIVVTWSLENAIDTADSMKSRGYGLGGRTAYALYRLDDRDRAALAAIGCLAGFIVAMGAAGGLYCRYFPTFRMAAAGPWTISALLAYAALCAMPTAIDMAADRRWRRESQPNDPGGIPS